MIEKKLIKHIAITMANGYWVSTETFVFDNSIYEIQIDDNAWIYNVSIYIWSSDTQIDITTIDLYNYHDLSKKEKINIIEEILLEAFKKYIIN